MTLLSPPGPKGLTRDPRALARLAAVHWQNARVALALAIQHRDLGHDLASDHHRDRARAFLAAARQCGQLAAFYRRRLAAVAGARDAAVANALHRSGVLS
jgi:hypothetical protein